MGGGLSAEKHQVPEVGPADLARILLRSSRVVALTGSGSKASDKEAQIRSVANIDGFRSDPSVIWKAIRDHVRSNPPNRKDTRPDLAALSQLEQLNLVHAIVTQSVDGSHADSGSKHVIEVDGSFMRARCTQCDASVSVRELNILKGRLPPRCEACDGILRPDVALAGESKRAAERQLAQRELSNCDCVLVLGVENPSTELPSVAKAADAVVIEMGPVRTDFTGKMADLFAPGTPDLLVPQVLAEVRRRLWHEFRIFAEGVDADDEGEEGEGEEEEEGGSAGGARSHALALDGVDDDGSKMDFKDGLKGLESERPDESVMGSARSGKFSARSFQQAGGWTDRSARGPGGGGGFMSARGGPKASARGDPTASARRGSVMGSARGAASARGGGMESNRDWTMVPDSARSGTSDAALTETARQAKLAALKKKAWGAAGGLGAGSEDEAGGWEDPPEDSTPESGAEGEGAAGAKKKGEEGKKGPEEGKKKMTKAALKAQSERAVFGGEGEAKAPRRERFVPGLETVAEVGAAGESEELALLEELEEARSVASGLLYPAGSSLSSPHGHRRRSFVPPTNRSSASNPFGPPSPSLALAPDGLPSSPTTDRSGVLPSPGMASLGRLPRRGSLGGDSRRGSIPEGASLRSLPGLLPAFAPSLQSLARTSSETSLPSLAEEAAPPLEPEPAPPPAPEAPRWSSPSPPLVVVPPRAEASLAPAPPPPPGPGLKAEEPEAGGDFELKIGRSRSAPAVQAAPALAAAIELASGWDAFPITISVEPASRGASSPRSPSAASQSSGESSSKSEKQRPVWGPPVPEDDVVELELQQRAAREKEAERLVAQETAAAVAEADQRRAASRPGSRAAAARAT